MPVGLDSETLPLKTRHGFLFWKKELGSGFLFFSLLCSHPKKQLLNVKDVLFIGCYCDWSSHA